MRLISRSVLREIWPPFALGFCAYTFILLVRTIYFLADFFVRRSATFPEVAWLVILSIPWIVVLTLPMAFLLGVLIGIGRLSSDSEIIAMRACGVGSAALYRPTLGAAAALSIGVFCVYNFILPGANDRLARSMGRVAASSVVNVVQSHTFREVRPGLMLFFDRTGPDGRTLDGVFLKLGDEGEQDNRVIVARRGALDLEGDNLWLDLFSSTLHDYDKDSPSRYRTNFNQTQRLLVAGDLWNSPAAQVSYDKTLRAQSLSELFRTAARMRSTSPQNYRLAWVEIHKKFSIPLACFVFGVLAIPLAEASRRGGRGSGFAISLAIIVLYYVLLSGGETWAEEGKLGPGVAIWMPNIVLGILAALAIWRRRRERARWQLPRWLRRRKARAALETSAGPPRPRFSGWIRFPSLLDRYVLGRFLLMLLFVSFSVLFLAVVVDYADHIDKIAKNHPSSAVLLGYYRYFLLSIGVQIAPFAILLATLISLGILSKHNEDTAFKASGVSLHRLAAAIIVAAVAGAAFLFTLEEYALPFAEQREARFKNIIYGRPADYGLGSVTERSWHYGADGSIWHGEGGDREKQQLLSPTVYRFDSSFELVERLGARQADWDGEAWILRQGWRRTFGQGSETSYQTFLELRIPGDPPPSFAQERRTPEQMRFRELQRYARRLASSGYPTGRLETALQEKLATPLLLPLMALLAVPFAFRIGRRGTLAGVGVGLALGMVFLIATAFFTKLGEVGVLSAALAAWSPNILSGTGAAYLLLRLRT